MTRAQAAATVLRMSECVYQATVRQYPDLRTQPRCEWPQGLRAPLDVLDTLFHTFAHDVPGEAIRDAKALTLRPGILDATFARTHNDERTDASAKEDNLS